MLIVMSEEYGSHMFGSGRVERGVYACSEHRTNCYFFTIILLLYYFWKQL